MGGFKRGRRRVQPCEADVEFGREARQGGGQGQGESSSSDVILVCRFDFSHFIFSLGLLHTHAHSAALFRLFTLSLNL